VVYRPLLAGAARCCVSICEIFFFNFFLFVTLAARYLEFFYFLVFFKKGGVPQRQYLHFFVRAAWQHSEHARHLNVWPQLLLA
jgi:hypothetical protein